MDTYAGLRSPGFDSQLPNDGPNQSSATDQQRIQSRAAIKIVDLLNPVPDSAELNARERTAYVSPAGSQSEMAKLVAPIEQRQPGMTRRPRLAGPRREESTAAPHLLAGNYWRQLEATALSTAAANARAEPRRDSDDGEGSSTDSTQRPTKTERCAACFEAFTADTPCLYQCQYCRYGEYCADCVNAMFMGACNDESRMPPRCCWAPIPLTLASKTMTAEEIELYKEKYEEWRTPIRLYCPVPQCSAFISPRLYLLPHLMERCNGNIDTAVALGILPRKANMSSQREAEGFWNSMADCPKMAEVFCPKCNALACTSCQQLAHPTMDCEDAAAQDTAEAGLNSLLAKWGVKRCPRCRTAIRHMFGCTHINCRCGANFCFRCLLPIDECGGSCDDDVDPDSDSVDEDSPVGFIEQDAPTPARIPLADHDARWNASQQAPVSEGLHWPVPPGDPGIMVIGQLIDQAALYGLEQTAVAQPATHRSPPMLSADLAAGNTAPHDTQLPNDTMLGAPNSTTDHGDDEYSLGFANVYSGQPLTSPYVPPSSPLAYERHSVSPTPSADVSGDVSSDGRRGTAVPDTVDPAIPESTRREGQRARRLARRIARAAVRPGGSVNSRAEATATRPSAGREHLPSGSTGDPMHHLVDAGRRFQSLPTRPPAGYPATDPDWEHARLTFSGANHGFTPRPARIPTSGQRSAPQATAGDTAPAGPPLAPALYRRPGTARQLEVPPLDVEAEMEWVRRTWPESVPPEGARQPHPALTTTTTTTTTTVPPPPTRQPLHDTEDLDGQLRRAGRARMLLDLGQEPAGEMINMLACQHRTWHRVVVGQKGTSQATAGATGGIILGSTAAIVRHREPAFPDPGWDEYRDALATGMVDAECSVCLGPLASHQAQRPGGAGGPGGHDRGPAVASDWRCGQCGVIACDGCKRFWRLGA